MRMEGAMSRWWMFGVLAAQCRRVSRRAPPTHSLVAPLLISLVAALALAACQPATATHPSASPTAGHTSSATATPAASATPTRPAGPARYRQTTLVQGVASPDDLTFDAQGRLLFVDLATGSVERREANGAITTVARGLPTPEGIVALADGSLLVAAQGTAGQGLDELLRIPAQGGAPTIFARWTNTTGNEGLDSIALDTTTGELLIPDSPNGIVYRLSLDGQRQTVVARGFVRPVDALADPANGAVYIADEWGGRVVRVAPDGSVTTLAHTGYPDDLALDLDGSLLVTSLTDNSLIRLDPTTGARLGVVASGLQQPQGLAIDARGNLYVSEQDAHRIVEFVRQ